MKKLTFKEVAIAREQGWQFELMEDCQDVIVPDADSGDVLSDYTAPNAPTSQKIALVQRHIFVQDIQAARGIEARCPCSSNNASRARWTASATAALLIFPPPQRCNMKSHDRPRSTSAKTSATKTRVPLKVGFPWQMAGSATIYRPNSTRREPRFAGLLMI